MNKFIFFLSIAILFSNEKQFSISGKVFDIETLEPLIGVNIQSSKSAIASDKDGYFILAINFPDSIEFNYIGYESKQIVIEDTLNNKFKIGMLKKALELDIIVVSASASEKKIEEETVSIDVIKPYLIKNNNITNMSVAIEKVPGVKIIDGQISIRNGSGWAYSVGSRVQVLVDGQSYLSTGLEDVKWSFLPTDVRQVEVIKGASSVLYGSASMNGVVNIFTEWPTEQPRTSFSIYSGYYNKPDRMYTAWWEQDFIHFGSYLFQKQKLNDLPYYNGFSIQHKRRIGNNFDFVIGSKVNKKHSYLKFVDEYNLGLNIKTRYRDPKIDGLLYGINTNIMYEQNDRFFFFNDTTTGSYVPLTTEDDPLISEETYNSYSIVPHITYIQSEKIKHKLTGSYFGVMQIDDGNSLPSNTLRMNYQFQNKINSIFSFTTGMDYSYGWIVNSNLFNSLEPYTNSKSIYSQIEAKYGKMIVSFGLRNEHYEINNIPINDIDSVFYRRSGMDSIYWNSEESLLYTVFPLDTVNYDLESIFKGNSGIIKRLGINYKINPGLFFRSSFGEGFRNPSLIERYMKNYNNEELVIAQNPTLKSESGWSAEIGLKQIIPFQNNVGYIDLALFWMEYENYIELIFSNAYIPEKDYEDEYPNHSMTDGEYMVYHADNIGKVRITGLELTTMGDFNLFGSKYKFLAGYTFTYPADLNVINNRPENKTYWEYFIDSFNGLDEEPWVDQNFNDYFDEGDTYIDKNENGKFDNETISLLPFRHRNSARIDIESKYNKLLYGIGIDYNSGIEHIGWFMENFLGNLTGNRRFKYHNPYTLISLRFSYSFSNNASLLLNIKNAMNIEYAHRPGYMGEPRSIVLQYNYKL